MPAYCGRATHRDRTRRSRPASTRCFARQTQTSRRRALLRRHCGVQWAPIRSSPRHTTSKALQNQTLEHLLTAHSINKLQMGTFAFAPKRKTWTLLQSMHPKNIALFWCTTSEDPGLANKSQSRVVQSYSRRADRERSFSTEVAELRPWSRLWSIRATLDPLP